MISLPVVDFYSLIQNNLKMTALFAPWRKAFNFRDKCVASLRQCFHIQLRLFHSA